MSRILAIGDVHEPVAHPLYLQFCADLYDQWEIDTVVFIGDLLDWHGISFHAAHPDCPGPSVEAKLAAERIEKWYEMFPEASVCIGNHDARTIRLAESVNIPSRFLRDYADVWDTPGWDWADCHTVDDITFVHGTGFSGKTPALNATSAYRTSVVCGHVHSVGGVHWSAGPRDRVFGLDTGCGVDVTSAAMAYAKSFAKKPILSAGVIIDGHPYHEMMPCGRGETYHRDNA